MQKAGAKFNPEKAKWYNREYLRLKSDEELTDLFLPVLEEKGLSFPREYVRSVISFTKERATFVRDFWDIASYLFEAPKEYIRKDVDKFWKPETVELVGKLGAFINEYDGEWTVGSIGTAIEEYIKGNEWPMGKVMNALRLALAGSASGLGIADIVARIGREETSERIARAIETL